MTQHDDIWQGDLVRLRGVEPDDWPLFQALDRDTGVQREGYWITFPRSDERARKWALETSAAKPEDDNYRWVIESGDGTPVGSLNTHGCDARNGTFEFGITIAREHWGNGYAPDAIRLLLRYFFGERRYQKATSFVYEFNGRSLAMHRKLGFQDEGRIRRSHFTNGRHFDTFVLGMTAEEFFERHGPQEPA